MILIVKQVQKDQNDPFELCGDSSPQKAAFAALACTS